MAQPQEDQRGFEIGSDDIIKKGRFKADVPKEATEDDQSKVTKDSLDGGATPSSVGGCRWTKMKLGTIVLALFAVLALMIGLSVGFGSNKSDGKAATSSAASSALSLTLEQCLDEESSFSKSSKGSKSAPSSSKDTTSSTTATATATATAVVKVDAIDAKDEPVPTPVTPMPTYAVTAGSTPTVSTEVTGPPTTSDRDEPKVRELLGRELLRGASAAQSKKVPAEKAIATWSKPRKLEGCDALLDEYYGKSGKSSSKSKSGKSGCYESGSSESDKNSKSRKSSKCKDQPTEKPSESPSGKPSESPCVGFCRRRLRDGEEDPVKEDLPLKEVHAIIDAMGDLGAKRDSSFSFMYDLISKESCEALISEVTTSLATDRASGRDLPTGTASINGMEEIHESWLAFAEGGFENMYDKKLYADDLVRMIGKEETLKIIDFFEDSLNGLSIDCMYLSSHGDSGDDRYTTPWHMDDYATLEITLNDDYHGGHVLHLNSDGVHKTHARPGSATAHMNDIVHGITPNKGGAKYMLILKHHFNRPDKAGVVRLSRDIVNKINPSLLGHA